MSDTKDVALSGGRSVAEVKAQVAKIQELIGAVMREGEHYGASFPGDKKKNLLKPGADKLCFVFRLAPEYEVKQNELPNGHREFEIKTTIRDMASGAVVAQGLGSCSTMESKYRWRNAARKCPSCGKEAIIKGKEEYGGGWVCFKKKDGCGATFEDLDPAIVSQEVGKIENPDIADVFNTCLKIAKKRSYVNATITATAASDIFSQDADDLPHDEFEPRPAQGQKTTFAGSGARAPRDIPRGPMKFKDYIDLVNTLPNNDRAGWMKRGNGGRDEKLLGELAGEIRTTYQGAPEEAAAAPTETQAEKLRIEIMEFITAIVPEVDQVGARKALEGTQDEGLGALKAELQARYGDPGLFEDA